MLFIAMVFLLVASSSFWWMDVLDFQWDGLEVHLKTGQSGLHVDSKLSSGSYCCYDVCFLLDTNFFYLMFGVLPTSLQTCVKTCKNNWKNEWSKMMFPCVIFCPTHSGPYYRFCFSFFNDKAATLVFNAFFHHAVHQYRLMLIIIDQWTHGWWDLLPPMLIW